MSPELERLIQLQQLESAIADARAHIAAHPQRMADADARLAEADRVVQEATQRLKDAQEAKRTAEKDAAVFDGRLTLAPGDCDPFRGAASRLHLCKLTGQIARAL